MTGQLISLDPADFCDEEPSLEQHFWNSITDPQWLVGVAHDYIFGRRRQRKPRQPTTDRRFHRVSDAARYLGISSKAVRRLILHGELRAVQLRPGNSPFLLDQRDLDRWAEAHKNILDNDYP